MTRGPNSAAKKAWVRPPAPRKGWTYWISDEAKHFCEKTLGKKAIKLCERDVLVHELESIGLRTQFTARGWLGACTGYVSSHPIMVKEFLSNIVSRDCDAHTFTSRTRGKDIVFSVHTIREMLDLPVVDNPQWPLPSDVVPAPTEVVREITGGVYKELQQIKTGHMTPQYRILFKVLCSFIEPSAHTSDVTIAQAYLLYGIGRGYSFDLATKMWSDVFDYVNHPRGTSSIPFASLITRFLIAHEVHITVGEPNVELTPPICYQTLSHSNSQVTLPDRHLIPASPPAPNYPRITPTFPPLYAPPGFKIPWETLPSPSTSAPASSSVPPTPLDNNLLAFLKTEFASLHNKIDVTAAAILALGVRLSAIENRLEGLDFCAHVRETIVSEMTKSLDALAGCTRTYVSNYGTAPVVEVDNANEANEVDSNDEDDDVDGGDTNEECD
ncbi:hypothetical protein Vadar_001259 [Vaccinium darrowii]|uniref:Uncharacterized protein n=1 Tax=Vaccinium darrowii TaxID=229202 RepID=A0ACB7XEL5_9ERIC|nr:hypothetical protein Vadar_001259 [Vaccinium darrowii]